MPERIQLSRRKGWRMPANTVKVCRPGKWGNPVTKQAYEDLTAILGPGRLPADWRVWAVKNYEAWLGGEIAELGTPPAVEAIRAELAGKNLACWCPLDGPCHGDVLLELANAPA